MNALPHRHLVPVIRYSMQQAALVAALALVLAVAPGTVRSQDRQGADFPAALVLPEIIREPFTGDLPEIRERGVLRALVSFSRTDFFLQGARPRGIHVELLRLYQKQLNKGLPRRRLHVNIEYVVLPFDELIPALLAGKGDIVVGNLTVTPRREHLVDFATGKEGRVSELLVSHRDVPAVETLDDLSGRTVDVVAGSSHQQHLEALNGRLSDRGLAPVGVRVADHNLVAEDLLELVNAGVIETTVVDDYRARLWSHVLPDIVVNTRAPLSESETLGWAVRKDNPELLASLRSFSPRVRAGTYLGNVLIKRYYEGTKWITNPVSRAKRRRLDAMADLFRTYGERYSFDWLALAAQGYQESGLDQRVRSPAGAVGVMQVLPSTAAGRQVGIKNIHEIEPNIHAGTRYLAFLRDHYFNEPGLRAEDRQAFTWAAYNAGPGRVRTMRRRAEQLGLDPDRWFGNVEHAALAVVGQETVRYVGNVYKYYIAYKLVEEARSRREAVIRKRRE